MYRRYSWRKKRRRMVILTLLAVCAIICLVISHTLSDSSDNKSLSSNELSENVHSDAYIEMQLSEWSPEANAALEVNNTSSGDSSDDKKNENAGPKPYPESWSISENTEVLRTTLTGYSGKKFIELEGGGQVVNHTSVTNSTLLSESKLPPAFKISVNEKPQVLIMHTHTTEAYEPYVRESFDPSFNYRTTDETKNVAAVGEAICEKLENAGIAYIHDTTIHDYPSYTGAYERSAETVKAILEEYPSIKVVLDIHRDAIGTDTSITQPIAEIGEKEAAQIMIISGCDDGTMGMPDYMFNFRFACRLQEQMETMYPGLTRPVLFDYRRYNQNLTTGSLLIEVGSHGNTLEQAVYAGSLFGDALVQVLLDLH